jgi:AAA+ superfamily predicted ATPase
MENFFLKTQEIISPNYFHHQNGGQLVLQDKDEHGRKLGKPVTIDVKSAIVCLELDKKNKSIFQFFKNDVTDLCKIADRILFYSKNGVLYVFIVELKTESTGGAFKQVKASYVLSEYVVNTVRRMLNFNKVNVEYRGLIFSSKTYKLKSSPKDNFTKIENTNLKYQCLQSGQVINLDGLV